MSTHTQSCHWTYTVNEWQTDNFQNYLNIVFKDNDIKTIYDIGANVGGTAYTFLRYAQQHNKKINQIYCFEPDDENFNFMKKKINFINDNVNTKVDFIHKGIFYGKTTSKAYGIGTKESNKIHENVGGYLIDECAQKIVENRNSNGEDVFCAPVSDTKIFQLDTLENLAKNFLLPDLIKIDIEGSEKNLMENSTMLHHSKYIILEWNWNIDLEKFLLKYLPSHKIIRRDCDVLLQKITK